jgi:hypothetical protein
LLSSGHLHARTEVEIRIDQGGKAPLLLKIGR